MKQEQSSESMELHDENMYIAKYPKLVEFEDAFRNPEDPIPWKTVIRKTVSKQIASCNVKKSILKLFPFIETFRSYTWKSDLPNDVIAGLTSGVMMIPQGMAFAALSTLPPIVGLYISFFSSLTYFWLGTGRQLSWGCIAILSLMIATILDKYDNSLTKDAPFVCINQSAQTLGMTALDISDETNVPFNFSSASNSSNVSLVFGLALNEKDAAKIAKRIQVASGVSVAAGLIFIIASRLGLSQVTSLMSNSMITGFTVGISFHVATSQLKTMFGISVPRYKGPGAVIRTWISVLWNLPKTNVATLLTTVISILVLYLVKRFINDRYKKHLRIPVPIELIVVIIATLISKFAFLHDSFNVKVVETVPVGIPAPALPDFSLVTDYIGDGIIIIVIAYAQTLAMAKTMGLKHNYVVDSNQEMFACGMCSVVCGLFSGYISAASVSRSVVQDGAGGKTQVASVFAAVLVLLVILLIGPYFYYLPMCVLSAIIIVNLQSMFLKLLEIPAEWRKSRYDCAVWVFSFVACVVLNADTGLLAGVLFSVFLIVLRTMLTPIVEAGQIHSSPVTVELRSLDKYSYAQQFSNIKIIKIETPLYFINADIFTAKVISKTGIDPVNLKKQNKEIKIRNSSKTSFNNGVNSSSDGHDKMLEVSTEVPLKVIIFDAAGVAFIDLMGVQALQFVINEFTSVDVNVLITSVPENIIPMLKSTGFWSKHGGRLFLNVEAALASVTEESKTNMQGGAVS